MAVAPATGNPGWTWGGGAPSLTPCATATLQPSPCMAVAPATGNPGWTWGGGAPSPSTTSPSTGSYAKVSERWIPGEAGQSGAPPAVAARGIPLTTLCPTPSPSRPQHTLPHKAVALATRRASDPAIRPWRLRRDGYTLPPCVTRPPPTPACRTQPAGSPLGAGIARKAVPRTPKTVRVGQDESYLRRTVSKLIRSPKKKTLEVERIAGVPLVLRGHPRRLLRRRRLGRAPHLPAVAPAHPPPARPSRP